MIRLHRNRHEAKRYYAEVLRDAEREGSTLSVMNELGRRDLFYLLLNLLHRRDIDNDFLFDRCMEVQREPNGMLDLWAREHYKSTIITFAKSIQDIVDSHSKNSFYWDQEVTIGIFSHTKAIAKKFLNQIKSEFETNKLLQQVYSDVLWQNPKREASLWSLDKGIIVKRATNPKEATIEAHGLVDGQPTSAHFVILNYDDVVTRESVYTPDQIKNTLESWELSTNLGAHGGVSRYAGTRYHSNDTYRTIIERKAAVPRIHAATDDGTAKGKPVFLSQAALDEKRQKQGPYTFACQQLQNPKAEDAMGFQMHWVRKYDAHSFQTKKVPWPKSWNYYLISDPASKKKRVNDYTCTGVIALGPDKNYYLVDGIRDRLNLKERTAKMFEFHRKYPILKTGYEEYGKDADIEHIEEIMERDNYRFDITPLGGHLPKEDRIRRLVPPFADKRFWIPYHIWFMDYEDNTKDFVKLLLEDELDPFPVAIHDDMLDMISRIRDPKFGAVFPKPPSTPEREKRKYNPLTYRGGR